MKTGGDLHKVICCVPHHKIKKSNLRYTIFAGWLTGYRIVSLFITYCVDIFPLNKNSHLALCVIYSIGFGLGTHLFVKVPRPGDSEVAFSVFG